MAEFTPEERRAIYEEEKSRLEISSSNKKTKIARLALWIACALVLLCVGAGFGYHEYRVHQLKSKLEEAIGRDLGLTETILKIETESTHMTYGELFKICDGSVEDRTKLIVELRGLYPDLDYKLKSRLVDYLNAENELVRAKRDFYRKSMELSSNVDFYKEELSDYPTSAYGWDFYRDRLRKQKQKLVESATEAEKGATDFQTTFDAVAKQEASISIEAKAAGLRFNPIFQKYAESNRKAAQQEQETAKGLETI